MPADFTNISLSEVPHEGPLRKLAETVISAECGGKNIHVIFCTNPYIQDLNSRFLKKHYATDVLSFNYSEPELLGEIYISLEKAREQALSEGTTLYRELRRLLVHGCMHLAGFHHDTPQKQKKMNIREEYYLSL